jgi:hypothetical protein
VVAKQVAREGFSGEMWVCLNLNEVENILDLDTHAILTIVKERSEFN